ncbi:MAG: endonuclease [Phycisphaerales bacterium]|nr:endonuclease [Phycisphaerales bacterium]
MTTVCSVMMLFAVSGTALGSDQYDPPASYYSGATGTGTTLKTQLTAAMSAGHIQRSYGDFRVMSRYVDVDPNNPSNILLVYNGASVSGLWDSGSTWNREHVWPQSRQPGSASNSSRGNLGDAHALKPCNPSINSSRGNKPFGLSSSSGGFGSLGTYYFPGDMDKGDIARSLFYSDTRWSSQGLSLVNGVPSGNQMGDLSSLLAWHYLDAPDEFERRRNHAISDVALNPFYYTNNRNAFIDHPEYVWSIYVDQNNDSTIWVGSTPNADGSSSMTIDFNAIVGDSTSSVPVTINKDGSDGTYYTVTPTSGINTSVWTNANAFPMNTPSDSSQFSISLPAGATDVAGMTSEFIIIDNLDVTNSGGTGNGNNDGDDVITVNINVFTEAAGSLASGSALNEITIDLGTITLDGGDATADIVFFNNADLSTGAPMDVNLISSSGDTSALITDFSEVTSVQAQGSESIEAILYDDAEGTFSASFTFESVNAEALFGTAGSGTTLVVNLIGEVGSGVCIPDFAEPFGQLNFLDVSAYLNAFGNQDLAADLDNSGSLNFLDVSAFLSAYGDGCP